MARAGRYEDEALLKAGVGANRSRVKRRIIRMRVIMAAANFSMAVESRRVISPTHKRTNGRAPVWGSEFTSKRRRSTGGDPAETAARLNVKLRNLRFHRKKWSKTYLK